MSESKEIQKAEKCNVIVDFIDGFDGVVNKSNCKFCQSKFRQKAEDEYDKLNNMKIVHKFLQSKGEEISYMAVRNHILIHYKKQERALKLQEYSGELKKWLAMRQDRRASIEGRIAILSNEMVLIAAETVPLSLDERRRSVDAIKKISDTITGLEDKQDEIEGRMEPVYILIENLKNIISSRIKKSTSEEVKRELMSVLEDLSKSVGDLEIGLQQ
jgi:hypothetical protein